MIMLLLLTCSPITNELCTHERSVRLANRSDNKEMLDSKSAATWRACAPSTLYDLSLAQARRKRSLEYFFLRSNCCHRTHSCVRYPFRGFPYPSTPRYVIVIQLFVNSNIFSHFIYLQQESQHISLA